MKRKVPGFEGVTASRDGQIYKDGRQPGNLKSLRPRWVESQDEKKEDGSMFKIFQQGDVVLKAIKALPAGEQIQDDLCKRRILALGEATGHAHTLLDADDSAQVVRVVGQLYMIIAKATMLKHEEHREILIPPGTYQVDIVRETDHISQVVRRVAD